MLKWAIIGLLVHMLVLWAGLDVYFKSPLLPVTRRYRTTENPPANRLVLIVADGLRAESIFMEDGEDVAPFLHAVRMDRGSWGISHAIVPSESRPGHVALLAGIHEDPSALFKGWKENPVDFDSVVNQSNNAWGWGSPDIMQLFNKDQHPHIHFSSYDPDMIDFAKNSTELDHWVLRKLRLELVIQDDQNCTDFCANGNFFFLHLLGTDTAGHAHKPYSQEYRGNIKYADEIAQTVEEMFETVFIDGKTVYVFTSDHGMTDWGSHGSGSAHETEVPFIAWGAGIKSDPEENDVNQADITPLMAALIGLNIPVHSIGMIPHTYLDVKAKTSAEIVLANTKQLSELYMVREAEVRNKLYKVFYKPFGKLADNGLTKRMTVVEDHLKAGRYNSAIAACREIMKLVTLGRIYYQNYFQKIVLANVTTGILLWIYLLMLVIASKFLKNELILWVLQRKDSLYFASLIVKGSLVPISFLVVFFTLAQSLPMSYIIYFLFPVGIAWFIASEHLQIAYIRMLFLEYGISYIIIYVITYSAALTVIICGFYLRASFMLLFIGMTIWGCREKKLTRRERLKWAYACLSLAFFTVLPSMKAFHFWTFCVGLAFWQGIFVWVALRTVFARSWSLFTPPLVKGILKFQLLLAMLAMLVAVVVRTKLSTSSVILGFCKSISWFILGVAFILPIYTKSVFDNLASIVISFASYYILVSVNYELLFLAVYVTSLYIWLQTEDKLANKNITMFNIRFQRRKRNRLYTLGNYLRQALFFLAFIFIGFFGTGNIASISSFDPMWVRSFLTVFSPFTMTALILLKLFVPFVLASSAFRAVSVVCHSNETCIFTIIAIFADVLLAYFFNNIKNVGSWLEIGTSLSQFIICDVIVIVLPLLYGIAYLLTSL